MQQSKRDSVIGRDMVVEGTLETRGNIVVAGRVQGELSAEAALIAEKGVVYGTLAVKEVEVAGEVQGDVRVEGLISITRTGSVLGKVAYGQIAMEEGATLSATLKNVPPRLGGDLNVTVGTGGVAKITTSDLTAFDPDDAPEDLAYKVSRVTSGFVALESAPDRAVTTFTQADLEAGRVIFVHDGKGGPKAGFDVVVADAKGATSGAPQHVSVNLRR